MTCHCVPVTHQYTYNNSCAQSLTPNFCIVRFGAPKIDTHTCSFSLWLSISVSISFSPRFGYFCTFVLNVCLCLSVCAWKSCVFASLFLAVCVFVPRRQRTLLPTRDCWCTHASRPAPATSQCNALRKKWPGEWCVCSSPSPTAGGATLIITHVFVAVLQKCASKCRIAEKCQV